MHSWNWLFEETFLKYLAWTMFALNELYQFGLDACKDRLSHLKLNNY